MAAKTIPEEEVKRLKGLGFLNNKDTDNFSARVITGCGRVTADTLRALADAADAYGDGHIVFTTRLTAEVPGIPYEKIDAFTEEIGKAGLEPGPEFSELLEYAHKLRLAGIDKDNALKQTLAYGRKKK